MLRTFTNQRGSLNRSLLVFAGSLLLSVSVLRAQNLVPIKGKWNAGDARDHVGVWKKSDRSGYLDGDGDGDINGVTARLGINSDIPFTLDYTGDEREEIGLYRPSTRELTFYSDYSSTGASTYTRTAGDPGDIIITGDWDGDGKDGFATYKPGSRSIWYFQNYNSSQAFAHVVVGNTGDIPITGNWDGFGGDGYALYRPNTREIWFFQDYDDTNSFQVITIGNPSDIPMAGDWDGNGADGVAVFHPVQGTSEYQFWLTDEIGSASSQHVFWTDRATYVYDASKGRSLVYPGGVAHTDIDGNPRDTYSDTQSFLPKGVFDAKSTDLPTLYSGGFNLSFTWTWDYPLDDATKTFLDQTGNQLRTIPYFERPGGMPFTGRFTGGRDLPGISNGPYSNLNFVDTDGDVYPDYQFRFGGSNDILFSGDWDGNGTDEFAIYSRGNQRIEFYNDIRVRGQLLRQSP